MGERLNAETIDRLRTWAFLGVVVCAGLIIGLSNAVWSTTCSDFLGFITPGCYSDSGVSSEVLFGFGDGKATATLGMALLAISGLAFAFPGSRGTWMVWGTMVGFVTAALTILPAQEYWSRGTISQSLMLMTAAAIPAPVLSWLFVWLDIKHEQATVNGDNAWA
ncbi:MAG TPA: hypothetical protein VMR52_12740 [Dehalococcoidia bacterium]|nr:hypothetical protein [Dehalococcoidia bacterium]